MQAFNAYWTGRVFLTKSSGYVKIPPSIPGYLKIKHPLRVEKNSPCQDHTSNGYDRVKLFVELGIEQRYSWTIGAHYRRYRNISVLAQLISSGRRQFGKDRSRDNRIVYDETLDACLPALASSAPSTMAGRKSPIL